jgi:hypothetical protein
MKEFLPILNVKKHESTNLESSLEENVKNLEHIMKSEIPCFISRISFHKTFTDLKDSLKLDKFCRKSQIDSLLKKSKSKVMRAIQEAIKFCLKTKLDRLPQNFITNIKIEFNKKYLNKTILEIYQEFGIISSFETLEQKNIIKNEKKDLLKELLSMEFKKVYNFYITSKIFLNDFQMIFQREGYEFATLFKYISSIFVNYYTYSKGNHSKKGEIN